MMSSEPTVEITPAWMPPYGPDFFLGDPILAYVAPLAVVLAGAVILRRWRDQILVATIADVVFLIGFFLQAPSTWREIAADPVSLLTWQTIWIWLAVFFTLALVTHGLKRVVIAGHRYDAEPRVKGS